MHSQTVSRRSRREGFTLIELLLVLAILVVLGAMATAIFGGTREKALVDAAKGEIGILKGAVDRYEWHMKEYPSSLEDLINQPSGDNASDWGGPYLDGQEINKDPWNNDYRLAAPGKHNEKYDLWSLGPDRQDGTDDDIGNW
ncbi:type II secretion system major pseudopilin GspG [Aeoliella mucimassa]|uniref:Type II secretion system core protein G n=1 Tax=Aeoliella mucimassa TaxID=2527972 RepID=A0A518AL47_9BACT|nr:type II secretion system major pseudopilin GspG [Aeoliella mucimassa]QDU55447.1 Type II secretion system protein G precursor [Aeoliella mucimassa]